MLDPLATTAERCAAGILDPVAPITGPALEEPHPHVIAERGHVPAPGWPRAYYLDGVEWVDTETGELWEAPHAV